jgi:hypothetical protein
VLLGTYRVTGVVRSAVIVAMLSALGVTSALAQGFTESATGNAARAKLSAGEIQTFLPQRGAFTFPAPYQTGGVRLTNSGDCHGQDCVIPVGYSYWSNINNHAGSDTMLVFLGLDRNRGGGGPTLFSYNKRTGETRNLGPLFGGDSPYSANSGEGWYFSGTQATKLYMNDGPRMLRYDVSSKAMETIYDIRSHVTGASYIKQVHSSQNDQVHSATVLDGGWRPMGCVAYNTSTGRASYFASRGDFDECQIDKSGRWLVIKENVDGTAGEDNRIIDLTTGAEKVFYDQEGAAGHSDLGHGYMVAEDNYNDRPGAIRVWRFDQEMRAQGQGTRVYELTDWTPAMMHVAHGNAKPGTPISQQMACTSSVNGGNAPRLNEIVCYRLDGTENTLIVAPNMVHLSASGGGSDDYSKAPKGNIDPTGEYFIWTSNMGTNRADAFIVRIPTEKLGVTPGSPAPSPAPAPAPSPAPAPAPSPAPAPAPMPAPAPAPVPAPPASGEGVRWMSLINITANGNGLQKTGGCAGCPDASAVSEQQMSASGALNFIASESGSLRFVGLASGGIGTGAGDMNFAIRLQGGVAEVRESGAYRTEVGFAAGDTFRISVEGGVVRYAKNGAVFYTSGSQATYAVRAHAVFFDMNAAVGEVVVSGGGEAASTSPSVAAPAPAPSTTGQPRRAVRRPADSTPVRRKPSW